MKKLFIYGEKLFFGVSIALLIACFPCSAQVSVENDVSTDTVDLFTPAVKEAALKTKSTRLAMMANLLVPGLGNQYLGKRERAFGYFAAEAFFIMGFIFSERYSNKLFDDSRSYAWMYAGTQSGLDHDDKYWKIIGNKNFMNYLEYNDAIGLNRDDPNLKYASRELRWQWESEDYRNQYNEFRDKATRFHIASTFFLGAMVLNRIVSFVDTRIVSKNSEVKTIQSGLTIEPSYYVFKKQLNLTVHTYF